MPEGAPQLGAVRSGPPLGNTVQYCHRCRPVFCTACSFLLVCKHLGSERITHIRSAFLLVTPGILGSQARPACTHRQL